MYDKGKRRLYSQCSLSGLVH